MKLKLYNGPLDGAEFEVEPGPYEFRFELTSSDGPLWRASWLGQPVEGDSEGRTARYRRRFPNVGVACYKDGSGPMPDFPKLNWWTGEPEET